ncbi:MAG: succinyldiaminopimelate transaminase [Gammaproteobacteria bacterium]|nr:succinyldiaminopimelate transaminase [Gammaproteobacteria bacterium]
MNLGLAQLQSYPFEKLAALKAGITPIAGKSAINLSIGEPQHKPPQLIFDALHAAQNDLQYYPKTRGELDLRETIVQWLNQRFGLTTGTLQAERHILPVNGTREALFSIVQTVVDNTRTTKPTILMPNPFYQIYEGAALLAGAEPVFYSTDEDNDFLPDWNAIPADVWQRCALIFICSPSNPTGRTLPLTHFKDLIALSDKYNFVIASDECYADIYFSADTKPIGILEAAQSLGRSDFKNCLAFHSLSKRSNVPGLRSGFVAGDAALIEKFFLYRTYLGGAMSRTIQRVSIAAWQDEAHVQQNRAYYREKFQAVIDILSPVTDVHWPDASFYIWLKTPIDDTIFTHDLFAQQNVSVLPGSFLSRNINGRNPGNQRIRMALVAELPECIDAAQRMREFLHQL